MEPIDLRAVVACLCLVFFAAPAQSQAQSPEQEYLTMRKSDVAEADKMGKDGKPYEQIEQFMKTALANLDAQFRKVAQPVAIAGFPKKGSFNLGTLSQEDAEYGALDGLVYQSADESAKVIVTTPAIAKDWIEEHNRANAGDDFKIPENLEQAAASDAFFTFAFSDGAAAVKLSNLPINPVNGAEITTALLGAATQDLTPDTANEIYVSLARGERLYVAHETLKTEIGPFPACQALYKKITDNGEAESKNSPKKSDAEQQAAREIKIKEVESAAQNCFLQHAPQHQAFSAARDQAQNLADRLAAAQ